MSAPNSHAKDPLRVYGISPLVGFALQDPEEKLPIEFHPWIEILHDSENLLKSKQFRSRVDQLSVLDYERLISYKHQRLARLVLCLLVQGYVWQDGDAGVLQSIPKCLAVPFHKLSMKLGWPAMITHADMMSNYKKIDPNCPLELSLCGGKSFEWFFLIPLQMEINFAQHILPHILQSREAIVNKDTKTLGDALCKYSHGVEMMTATLTRMHEHCDPREFYNFRAFLAGWQSNVFKGGIIYEGISSTPVKHPGASAAQSSTLHCCDEVLGVKHGESAWTFLSEMRQYMPPGHREFIASLVKGPSIRDFVISQNDVGLAESYNKALLSLVHFRDYHIQVVVRYIVIPSHQTDCKKSHESLANVGTGGSGVLPFLKSVRDTTKAHLLPLPA
ncbi:PREDICTED: indoleamine 2,3-dioxygenase 2-like isoform X2 [Priapulus caudatus]|uniref:Indoleamine 2,3-dioxygenase 2-like isoform X2 n=1 Tax=Priapulus caudatus TaxID=37621 RepID=A0ABM1EJW8_PRICU|nr:PREDICTED: indoleamine 2,3-dioxygenase 2-like isoform X2 [Priapulus caudatus]